MSSAKSSNVSSDGRTPNRLEAAFGCATASKRPIAGSSAPAGGAIAGPKISNRVRSSSSRSGIGAARAGAAITAAAMALSTGSTSRGPRRLLTPPGGVEPEGSLPPPARPTGWSPPGAAARFRGLVFGCLRRSRVACSITLCQSSSTSCRWADSATLRKARGDIITHVRTSMHWAGGHCAERTQGWPFEVRRGT
jgi:hypothetical protein